MTSQKMSKIESTRGGDAAHQPHLIKNQPKNDDSQQQQPETETETGYLHSSNSTTLSTVTAEMVENTIVGSSSIESGVFDDIELKQSNCSNDELSSFAKDGSSSSDSLPHVLSCTLSEKVPGNNRSSSAAAATTTIIEIGRTNNDDGDEYDIYEEQTALAVLRQMAPSFLIAGLGSVFAGIVLNAVTQWPVFERIPQFEIMISAFIGLIGNIETTLASRLSTQANLGRLDRWESAATILSANMLVVQCQSSTVGFFAAIMSLLMSTFQERTRDSIDWETIVLLCSSSVITSVIANTILATLIGTVILVARKFRINPDNISTPVAASMGDVCSLAILAFIAQSLYDLRNYPFEICLTTALLAFAPFFGYFARQNRYSRSVIVSGWTAILGAVIVEQPGGIVMQVAFSKFEVMSTLQPLVNGIGSNLVGIQTSRMSTYLHSVSKKGKLPDSNPRYCVTPFWVFCSTDVHARMARLLMAVVVPAHIFYVTIIYFLQDTFPFQLDLTPAFIATYIIAVVTQLFVLLYLAYISVFWAWKRRINPDNSAIPFTSALADVLGNCLLAAAFLILASVADPNAIVAVVPDESTTPTFATNFTAF